MALNLLVLQLFSFSDIHPICLHYNEPTSIILSFSMFQIRTTQYRNKILFPLVSDLSGCEYLIKPLRFPHKTPFAKEKTPDTFLSLYFTEMKHRFSDTS